MTLKKQTKKGIFLAFEGGEGAGKSTLIQSLKMKIQSHYLCEPWITREPGGTPLSEKIRDLILSQPMEAWSEAFLYQASRAQLVRTEILPRLQRGEVILCDRYGASSLAYQSSARGLPWKAIESLNAWATDQLLPDRTIWIDVEPAKGLKKALNPNRFEEEKVSFHQKVRKGFLKAYQQKSWIKLKAFENTPDKMAEELFEKLQPLFKKYLKKRPT